MRSYWRRVCGCMPARRAATEMSSTFWSEACSIETTMVACGSDTAHPPFQLFARGRWGGRGELVERLARLGRQVLRHHDVDGDEQITDRLVPADDTLPAYAQGPAARRARG